MIRLRPALRILLAILFIVAGVLHFVIPEFYLKIMPPFLPFHLALVYISGFFEMLGGIGVLVSRVRTLAGYGLILLLILVFPANIYMLTNNVEREGWTLFSFLLVLRLPLQLIFIWLVRWCTKENQTRYSAV